LLAKTTCSFIDNDLELFEGMEIEIHVNSAIDQIPIVAKAKELEMKAQYSSNQNELELDEVII